MVAKPCIYESMKHEKIWHYAIEGAVGQTTNQITSKTEGDHLEI